MKKMLFPAMILLALGLIFITIQASANSPTAVGLQKTPGPPPTRTPDAAQPLAPPANGPHNPPGLQKTPGAKATEQAGQHGRTQVLRGTIDTINTATLVLQPKDGPSVAIGLTADTRIRVPGAKASGDTLLAGMQVVVLARSDQTGNLVARAVMAVPGRPSTVHRVGEVTAYTSGESITIQATDGSPYTFTLNTDTKILPADRANSLAVGSRVTIIAPRDPSNPVWAAKGIVVHPSTPG